MKESGFEQAPRRETIDLSQGWDTQAQLEIFISELKELGIYQKGALYHGTGVAHAADIVEEGPEGGMLFCSTEKELLDYVDSESAFTYALNGPDPAIVILDGSKLEEAQAAHQYRPKKGVTMKEATLAEVRLIG